MKRSVCIAALAVSGFFLCSASGAEVDVTGLAGAVVSAQHDDSPEGEGISRLTDGNPNTKFLTFNPSVWVVLKAPQPHVPRSYTLTSGNDFPERDPKAWTLEGSNNGVTWHPLDSRKGQSFSKRKETRSFKVTGDGAAYSRFRLNVLAIGGGTKTQIAEWRLHGEPGQAPTAVFADFEPLPPVEAGAPVVLRNASLNAESFQWSFPGGEPAASTERQPTVVFKEPGTYEIKLCATAGDESSAQTRELLVRAHHDWSAFHFPEVVVEKPDGELAGCEKYLELVKSRGHESIEDFVRGCCLTIAREMFDTPEEANEMRVRRITYKLRDGGALSYKAGSPPNLEIGFDLNYLERFAKSHSAETAADELYGVLCHEVCHCYQRSPRGAGGYAGGTEAFGFIEGGADLARLLTGGFNPRRHPRPGGRWTDGYNTTAFFYLWIKENHDPDFLKNLNRSAKEIRPWSLDAALRKILGKSAEQMWQEYQTHLKGEGRPVPRGRGKG